MTDAAEIARLQHAIQRLHGCRSGHMGSFEVHEMFEGKTVWEGTVEMFELIWHPTATVAYAWSYETDGGGRGYVAVLGVPPIMSPQDAVRASIAAEHTR